MNLRHLLFLIFSIAFGIKSGKIRPNFDEIFGEEWDEKESEEKLMDEKQQKLNKTKGGEMGTDPNHQLSEYSNQNVIKSDQNTRKEPNDQQKSKMVLKFEAIKEKLKKNEKYQNKDRAKIELKIAKLLGANRQKIYKWKKEMNLNKIKTNKMKKSFYKQKKKEFFERFDEFKSLYGQGKQKEFVKELGISEDTFIKWKKELLPKYLKTQNKYCNEEKLRKVNEYFEFKEKNPKISDEKIAKKFGIPCRTLIRWTKINF